MDSILPERLLALVRPGNDLVLQRVRSLKRCVQACGCKIMTPRYACKMPSSCVSARRAKKTRKKRKPSQTSQTPGAKPNQPESQPEAKPNQPESQPGANQNQPTKTSQKASQKPTKPARKPARSQPKPATNQKSQPGFPLSGLALQKQRQLLGILPNRISRGHYFAATPARSVLDFKSFAGRGHFLDGQVPGACQVE